MSRPLRIEFPGAVYHVTSRGDRREPIYREDADRLLQLDMLATALDRFDAQVLAYCQMGNHYHLVLYTRQGNLSRLMRHLNGVYTQAFNRRHGLVGHLFQGRFKAILVDRDAYLLALCRYVERNPVAAGLVKAPDAWRWSSCQAHLGPVPTPGLARQPWAVRPPAGPGSAIAGPAAPSAGCVCRPRRTKPSRRRIVLGVGAARPDLPGR